MDYGVFSVSVEGGFFDDVVKVAGVTDFFESELGIGFVVGDKYDGADSNDAIEKAASQTQIDNTEHVEVIYFSV